MIICNTVDYSEIRLLVTGKVTVGKDLLELKG